MYFIGSGLVSSDRMPLSASIAETRTPSQAAVESLTKSIEP